MIIENLAEIDIRYNPILEIVSRVRKEAPMTYSNVWKVFESMMQEKYTVDRLEIALGRQPRSLWDYLSDFMYLHYGV